MYGEPSQSAKEVARPGMISTGGNVPTPAIQNATDRLQDAIDKIQENTERLRVRLSIVMDNSPRPDQFDEDKERSTDVANLASVLHSFADRVNSINNQQNDILDRLKL